MRGGIWDKESAAINAILCAASQAAKNKFYINIAGGGIYAAFYVAFISGFTCAETRGFRGGNRKR